MNVSSPPGPQAATPDPRLQPTPDYGTLGPGSDVAASPVAIGSTSSGSGNSPRPGGNRRVVQLLAMLAGIVAALLVSAGGGPARTLGKIAKVFTFEKAPSRSSARSSNLASDRDLDRQRPQKQAEILLARAVSRNDGAADQIQARVDAWHGKLHWDSQISDLTTAALNSNDQNVRASAIEVQLAAYGVAKNQSTVNSVIHQADSSDHAQKVWALWTLGLLGNRGVETDRVVQVLAEHLNGPNQDADEDSRRWAVEGLALVGTNSTIGPLLHQMHDDPSPLVRERAACSLAESGMLSHAQRLTAVPQLIHDTDDPALDAQTRGWAFQALHDITRQSLPNDSSAWRNWYQTYREGQ